MANIFDNIKSDNSTISLKYYGVGDIATEWDIKYLLENAEQIQHYYASKVKSVDTFDDYIDYLFINKAVSLKDGIDGIVSDENKSIILEITDKLSNDNCYKIGDVIKFINSNIETILNQRGRYFDLDDVTLELCAQYQNGIHDELFLFLAQNRPYLLIYKYDAFQKRLEKSQKIIVQLFESATKDKDCRHNLRSILDIMRSICERNPDLFKQLDRAVENIIDLGMSIAQQVNKENVIYCERQFNTIHKFLKNIRNVKANEFSDYKNQIDELLKQYVLESGSTFSYELPTNDIKKMLEGDKSWINRLIQITHSPSEDRSCLISNLNMPPHNKHPLMDFVSTNRPTNDYFTLSHQNLLDIKLTVGGYIVFIMLTDKKLFDESLSCLSGLMNYICEVSNCTSNNIEQDFQLLIQMLNNVFYSNIQDDDDHQVIQSLCYGTAMFICSFLEKLLRNIYVALKRNELYIPVNKATLGELLSSGNNLFNTIFGEYQLRHLNFFFCADKNGGNVGYNLRNKLAHWSEMSRFNLTPELVSKLLYLLISVINSLYLYFSSIMQDKEEENYDQL